VGNGYNLYLKYLNIYFEINLCMPLYYNIIFNMIIIDNVQRARFSSRERLTGAGVLHVGRALDRLPLQFCGRLSHMVWPPLYFGGRFCDTTSLFALKINLVRHIPLTWLRFVSKFDCWCWCWCCIMRTYNIIYSLYTPEFNSRFIFLLYIYR